MDKDTIADDKARFAEIEEFERDNRILWLEDHKFARLSEQWPEGVKRQRELDGRPCLTINRLPSFIRQVTNATRQNKPAIRVHPVDDTSSQATAQILDGLIRNIEYTSSADVAYDTALDHAVTGGFGYFRINTAYADDDTFDQDIVIERIVNPLTVYGDDKSVMADSSDWNDAYITELYTKDEFLAKWKGAETASWQTDYQDMKDEWCSGDMVRVAERWLREEVPTTLLKLSDGMVMFKDKYLEIKPVLDSMGITVTGERPSRTMKVTQRIITGAEVLETNDWAGKYIPIVPVYGDELNIEGKRHFISLIRDAKDAQQMFNYWRTASTELVALAPKTPYIGPRGAFATDADKWATANVVSHPYIEYDGGVPPQRQPFAGPPAGALQEALNASDDMKSIMGIYDAALGARSNETSGRAILARQRESDVSTFNFVDNLSRAIRHAGRILVDLIPKVYSGERVIRVIGEDESNEMVPINQPLPPEYIQKMQQKAQDQAREVVQIYDLANGKYDVTVQAGPSYTTKRQESAEQMMNFLQAFPQATPMVGDLIAKNLDWPGADDIAKRLKSMLPPHLQDDGQNQQVMMLQQQMQQMDMQAKQAVQTLQQQIEQLNQQLVAAKTDKEADMLQFQLDAKTAELKVRELEIKEFEAQTKRIEVETRNAEVMAPINIATAAAAPKQKRMMLKAPSGAVYEGIVVEETPEVNNG